MTRLDYRQVSKPPMETLSPDFLGGVTGVFTKVGQNVSFVIRGTATEVLPVNTITNRLVAPLPVAWRPIAEAESVINNSSTAKQGRLIVTTAGAVNLILTEPVNVGQGFRGGAVTSPPDPHAARWAA